MSIPLIFFINFKFNDLTAAGKRGLAGGDAVNKDITGEEAKTGGKPARRHEFCRFATTMGPPYPFSAR